MPIGTAVLVWGPAAQRKYEFDQIEIILKATLYNNARDINVS